jgi:hypothetical protein
MIQVRAETETAVREVVTTYREMISKHRAMQASQIEIDYLTSRWRLLAGDQQLAGVVLNDLLAAHERLADAEYDFAAAEAAYNVSLVSLNVVTGTLLQAARVEISDARLHGVPAINVRAEPAAPAPDYESQSEPVPTVVPEAVPYSAPSVPLPTALPPAPRPTLLRQSARLLPPEFPAVRAHSASPQVSAGDPVGVVARSVRPEFAPLPSVDQAAGAGPKRP